MLVYGMNCAWGGTVRKEGGAGTEYNCNMEWLIVSPQAASSFHQMDKIIDSLLISNHD